MEHSGAFARVAFDLGLKRAASDLRSEYQAPPFIHCRLRPNTDRGRIGKMSFCRVDWVVSGILQRVVGHHGHLFARNRPIRLKGAVRVAVNDISIDVARIAPAYQSDEATS